MRQSRAPSSDACVCLSRRSKRGQYTASGRGRGRCVWRAGLLHPKQTHGPRRSHDKPLSLAVPDSAHRLLPLHVSYARDGGCPHKRQGAVGGRNCPAFCAALLHTYARILNKMPWPHAVPLVSGGRAQPGRRQRGGAVECCHRTRHNRASHLSQQ